MKLTWIQDPQNKNIYNASYLNFKFQVARDEESDLWSYAYLSQDSIDEEFKNSTDYANERLPEDQRQAYVERRLSLLFEHNFDYYSRREASYATLEVAKEIQEE